jgi:hypothetical protein
MAAVAARVRSADRLFMILRPYQLLMKAARDPIQTLQAHCQIHEIIWFWQNRINIYMNHVSEWKNMGRKIP